MILRASLGLGAAAPDPDRSMPRGPVERELHLAIAELPLVGPKDTEFQAALSHSACALLSGWQDVARAAVALEAQSCEGLSPKPASARDVAQDVAALMLVVLDLDQDLAKQLPAGFRAERVRLTEQPRHGRARLASYAILERRA